MKKYFLIALVLILSLTSSLNAFASFTELRPVSIKAEVSYPAVEAESAILINGDTGEVLYEKNAEKIQYPASITKLMTVLLALENGNPESTLTFSHDAVFSIERGSNHIAIDEGEKLPFMDALYAILLESANEVSNGMAEHISGSMEDFSTLMNIRAKELGCTNTNFVNAHGLHDDNHYTTAHDMALIAKELLKFDLFKQVATTTTYEIAPTNIQSETRYMHMQNKMVLPGSNYYYEPCIGGKTGFTDQALNTLVTYAKKDGMTLICVVLRDNGAATYTDSIALFDYGFNNYTTASLFTSAGYETTVKTESGETITLKADGDFGVTVPKDTNISAIQKVFSCPDTVSSVKRGEAVGSINFTLGDTKLGSVKLLAQTTVNGSEDETSGSFNIVDFITKVIIFLIAAFIIFFVYCYIKREIHYRRRKRRRKERLKEMRRQMRE